MQCPDCQLENEEGALYCARCHRPMPRKLVPGECPHCGRMPEPGELPPAVCPSCGGDPERGKEIREKRLTALRAEVALQTQTLEARRQEMAARKGKKGCGLTLLLFVIAVIGLGSHFLGRTNRYDGMNSFAVWRSAQCPTDTHNLPVSTVSAGH